MTDTGPRQSPDAAPHGASPHGASAQGAAALVFDDPLSRPSEDDRDEGWGDRPVPGGGAAAELARFLNEKPPHHL